jgi:GT2 family glycosyltransferase
MMDITTVIINFQTPDLLKEAVNSFKTFYPDTKLLLIDNGSKDDGISKSMIEDLSSKHKDTEAVLLENNIFHGPAMDKAIR